MAITERDRRNIFNGLEEAIGHDAANHLMELLPTTPAAHLVTRDDMHANTLLLRGEMAELRGELRAEMADLRSELRQDMTDLRSELRQDMATLRGEFVALESRLEAMVEAGFARTQVATQRMFMGALLTNVVAVVVALTS